KLIVLGEHDHLYVLILHQIIADESSIGVLLKELTALYSAYVTGAVPSLPQPGVQYADYADWQRQWLAGEDAQHLFEYWAGQLRGAPSLLSLPTDHPRLAAKTCRGGSVPLAVAAPTVTALRQVGQQAQATLFMTLVGAFSLFLSRYAGQDDICVGTPVESRQRTDVESMIGCFVDTLVLRTRVDERQSFSELLQQVRRTTLDAYAHQDAPFERVMEALSCERHASHNALFQAMLVLKNTPASCLALADLTCEFVEIDRQGAKFDLTLTLTELDGGLSGNLEYSSDLFDRATIERMAQNFGHLLAAAASRPNVRIHELEMLGEHERRRLLVEWNRSEQAHEPDSTLHELVEEQANRTPGRPAVRFKDRILTYHELNACSNRLARYLRRRGVREGVPVGLRVERCAALVVGMLGVLKAGGIYVPLDPGAPRDRLAYMIERAAPAVVLTQE